MPDQGQVKPLAQQVLIGEIAFQSRLAEKAADQLARASGPVETWVAIQALLVAAANVSKILWPTRNANRSRGEELRDVLGVAVPTLAAARTFRNHLEDYDERVDEWFKGLDSAVYTDLASGPRAPTPFGLPRETHRGYDPTTQTLYFRDESIELAAVLATLEETREKCRPFVLTAWESESGADGEPANS